MVVILPIKEIINNINSTKDISIIIEQLRELKQSFINYNNEENDSKVAITSVLKLLLDNVLDNWYYAFTELDKQLFESFFFLPNLLSESFITLTTILSEYNHNNNNSDNNNNNQLYSQKLNFLFNILYKFINNDNNSLSKLFIEFQNRKLNKDNTNLEIHETVWNLIITSITLIPDKCRSIQYYYKNNRIRNTQSPIALVKDYILEFFTNNNLFYSKIIQQCIHSVNSSIDNSNNKNNINNIITLYSNQYSILFSKMIKIGEKDIIVNNFFRELFQDNNNSNNIMLKRKLSSKIIVGIHGSCLDTFLETIIKSLTKFGYNLYKEVFKSIFIEIFENFNRNEISMIVHIMINKILVLKVMDNNSQNCYLELLYSILKLEKSKSETTTSEIETEHSYLLFEILNNLLKSWKDSYFIRNSTNEHHAYLTRSIIYFIEILSKNGSDSILKLPNDKIEQIKHMLLNGIDVHLKFTITNINNRGMFVAELFAKLFHNNTETPLKFNYSLNTPDQSCFSTNFKPTFQEDDINNNATVTTNTTNLDKDISNNKSKSKNQDIEKYKKLLDKEFKKYDDPDRIMNDEDDEDEPRIKEINSDNDDDDDSDDDDLKPYDLNDDESDLSGIKKKIYLRDCLLELQSQKHTAESWENALISISNIVWSNPDDLDELSEPLATSLIHLTNEYDLESFSSIRHESLVALACQSTHIVIPYLTSAFKQKNFSIGQRIEILETISESAKELAGLSSNTQTQTQSQPPNNLFELNTSTPTPTPSIINQIGIVRKWGIKKTPRPVIKANRFHKYVKIYFYPLLEKFDKVTQCYGDGVGIGIGYDSYLLSRLVYTLGVIVECSGNSNDTRTISKELVKFLWSLKNHKDQNVRRSLLFSLSRVFFNDKMMTKNIIDQDYHDEIEDIASFLFEISQNDSDKDSRVMSIATLSKIVEISKNNN